MPNGFAFPVDGWFALEKLWENEAPTAAFAAQTVSLDFSQYELFLIVAMTPTDSPSGANAVSFLAFKNVSSAMDSASAGSLGPGAASRIFKIEENLITFNDARVSYGGSNNTVVNTHLIPHQIYGIKAKIT